MILLHNELINENKILVIIFKNVKTLMIQLFTNEVINKNIRK